MQALTNSGYVPEELFSQKGSTVKDAKFDKTLIADLSRQARHPMTIISANAAHYYDRVNHVVVSLVWLVLTNGNIPAIVASLVCIQTMKFFQRTGFGESKTFFGGKAYFPYMMGLGQMGALYVDNTDLYTWKEHIMDPGELWCQTQIELEQ